MSEVDNWLNGAARQLSRPLRVETCRAVDRLIAREPAPEVFAARGDKRRAMLSAAAAAIIAFTGVTAMASTALAKPAPTWLSAPPDASPFGLLIGR